MTRWTQKIENSISLASRESNKQDLLDAFFESKAYIPHNEEEEREFEEFSLVISSTALLVYIALADGIIQQEQKERIISDLIFQLGQRSYEREKLVEFGTYEKEIISNLYDKMVKELQAGKTDIGNIVRVVDMVYANNPAKRIYLVRLCYYCAYSDGSLDPLEEERIDELSRLLKIGKHEQQRAKAEVEADLKA